MLQQRDQVFGTAIRIGALLSLAATLAGCGEDAGGQGIRESDFSSFPSPSFDGSGPTGLIQGSDGNFYGTTTFGGQFQKGTVFRITPEGEETVVYSFAGGSDGAYPSPGLVPGPGNSFYGTTYEGGVGLCPTNPDPTGRGGPAVPPTTCGIVFNVTADGVETVLYSFGGLADGGQPTGALVQSGGDFYGTTNYGGIASDACGNFGCGTVFRVTPTGAESALYSFSAGLPNHNVLPLPASDNSVLPSNLVLGSDGYLYGVTTDGGATNGGTVFQITPSGIETVLHSFTGCISYPLALIQGSDGNFYGITEFGCSEAYGTVFKVTPSGVVTVLYSFTDVSNGSPTALIQGSDGNLYGTTAGGGAAGGGTLFELTPSGLMSVLHTFTGGASSPNSLIQASDGAFYGTTACGGANQAGTVFKINSAGDEIGLYSFNGGKNCFP
jgi:uncharacterized repeat protein (TIGR03803 family)